VVLLGERYDAFVERQLRLAHELEKRLVCWVRPGPAPADSRQHRLLDSLRDGTAQPCTLLERHSSRDLIRELLEALRGQPARAPAPSTGNPRVYLLYDPTTDRDANVVATVRTSIEAERLEVLTPQAGSTLDRQDQHRRLLHDCDAVLLCRGAAPAPDQWLFQTVPDVLFAEQQLSRPPMTSKGLLLANPTSFVGLPNVSVMPLTDAVSPAVLRPFLEPLRHARHG
jgi:hypothetical protein